MPGSADDIVAAFAAVPLFAGLRKRQLTALAKAAKAATHKPGHEIAAEGRGGLSFHVIADGAATVTVGSTVRRTLLPGDYFGEISMIDGEPRSATVTAGEQGLTTYTLNRTQFLALVDADRELSRAMLAALCGRIRAIEQSR